MFGKLAVMGTKAIFQLKRYSPEILIFGGVALMGTSTVLAVKATSSDRYYDILCDYNEEKEQMARAVEIADSKGNVDIDDDGKEVEIYSAAQKRQDAFNIWRRKAWGLTKLYAPAITTGVVGAVSILGGFKIIKGRNVALAAAYSIIDKAFKDYRARVVGELGKDKDTHFMYDTDEVENVETVIGEDGKKIKVKSTQQVLKGTVVSMYGRLFTSQGNPSLYCDQIPGKNWVNLKSKRDWLNDKFNIDKVMLLNDVYDELGFEKTTAGAQVGWVKGCGGDDYISFGPWCENLEQIEREGQGADILLDFNVDGPVYHLIDEVNAKKSK